jgi:hypothetical protein
MNARLESITTAPQAYPDAPHVSACKGLMASDVQLCGQLCAYRLQVRHGKNTMQAKVAL